MLNRRGYLLAGLALAALIAAVPLAGCQTKVLTAPASEQVNTVTASGNGNSYGAPDEARVNFGVAKRASDARRALSDASKAAEKVSAAIGKAGVAKKDIQTSNLSVYPQQTERGGKIVIIGYEASIQVTVRVRKIADLGDIITAANDAGSDNISGPMFEIAEDSAYRDQAITEAVADARGAAEAMAKAAGKDIGDVLNITTSNVTVPIYGRNLAYADAMRAAVPIETGQLQISANVTVVFELK
jgi:uncharacterized protein YggE